MPPPWNIPIDNRQVRLSERVMVAEAAPLDLLIERATDLQPTRRPSMADFRDGLRTWLSTAEYDPTPLDMDDLFAQVRVLNSAADAAASEHDRFRRLAENANAGMTEILSDLAHRIQASGGPNVDLRMVKGAWAYLDDGMALAGRPDTVWGECWIHLDDADG